MVSFTVVERVGETNPIDHLLAGPFEKWLEAEEEASARQPQFGGRIVIERVFREGTPPKRRQARKPYVREARRR